MLDLVRSYEFEENLSEADSAYLTRLTHEWNMLSLIAILAYNRLSSALSYYRRNFARFQATGDVKSTKILDIDAF
jgi:hypothetical protein